MIDPCTRGDRHLGVTRKRKASNLALVEGSVSSENP